MNNLLFDAGDYKTVVLIAACVLLVLAVVYGLIRKFSRMSWLGWQTALLFCATLPLSMIPETANGTLIFCVAAGGLVALTAFIFLVGALLRSPFLALEQGGTGGKVFNRLLGAVTSVFNIVVFVTVFGALALVCTHPFLQNNLAVVYENPVWTNFFAGHAFDLFLVFLFAGMLRWGYRTGFLRMIVTIVVLVLTLFAVFLAMYMTLQVPFLAQLSAQIAGAFKMNAIAAGWIGFGIVSLITAVVLMIAVILIALILNLLLKACGKATAFRVFDGLLFSLITCVFLFAFIIGFNFMVAYVASGALEQIVPEVADQVAEQMTKVFGAIESVLTSSPLSNIFYRFNPLKLLIPA